MVFFIINSGIPTTCQINITVVVGTWFTTVICIHVYTYIVKSHHIIFIISVHEILKFDWLTTVG